MEKIQASNSTEQRRKLLKGALATSSVVGLGYSGSSASASITQCIQNQANTVSGPQVYIGASPPSGSPWAWKKIIVEVNQYKRNGTGDRIKGFELESGTVYTLRYPSSVIAGAVKSNRDSFRPYDTTAWVIVYFDSEGEVGVFDTYKQPTTLGTGGTEVVAQASLNCVNSLQPGLGSSYTFGG